jgi:hypothetical protein
MENMLGAIMTVIIISAIAVFISIPLYYFWNGLMVMLFDFTKLGFWDVVGVNILGTSLTLGLLNHLNKYYENKNEK